LGRICKRRKIEPNLAEVKSRVAHRILARVGRRVACVAALTIALAGFAPDHSRAIGISPGTFAYKLHAPVPLLAIKEEWPYFQRVADVNRLFGAPFEAQAGKYADLSVLSVLSVKDTEAVLSGSEIPEQMVTELPPGPIVKLGDVAACSTLEFANTVSEKPDGCPAESQVGVVSALFGGALTDRTYPLYKLTAAHGHLATLGFPHELISQPIGVLVNVDLRADGDYGLTLSTAHIGLAKFVPAPFITIWGVPAAPIHDSERWNPAAREWGDSLQGPPAPLVANSTDCDVGVQEARIRLSYWTAPGRWLPEDPEDPVYRSFVPAPEGCDRLGFAPRAKLSPTSHKADSAAGIDLRLDLPPAAGELEAPPLKSVTLTLPEGMSVNPATADGLLGCTPGQIGLQSGQSPVSESIRFNADEPRCPSASKVGEGAIDTPIAAGPVEGDVYLATPFSNPFDSLLALYLVFKGPGFVAKLAAKVEADPRSGRLTASLESLPDLPIEAATLSLAGGVRAPLETPPGCGEAPIELRLTPSSAPQSDSPATIVSPYAYSSGLEGGECPRGDGSGSPPPELRAGSRDAAAGGSSPFVLHLEGSSITGFEIALPRGLAPRVRGIDRCQEAGIARAQRRGDPGHGLIERSDPSCPASSRVGSLSVGAGSAQAPLFVPGNVYLAGPYEGAPFSLVAITPILAGGTADDPLFDLGSVVKRAALDVNPRSGVLRARVAALPRVFGGIPLRTESLKVVLDRPGFMRSPSDCRRMNIAAGVESGDGSRSALRSGFRAMSCGHLGFAPKLDLTVVRGRARGRHPTVRAALRAKPGDAGIAGARLTLPASELLDRSRLSTECHAFPLARGGCPRSSIRGRASVHSALIDGSLRGPVYLRSSSKGPPELVLALAGRPAMELVGRLRFEGDRVRIEFSGLPDAHLTKLNLTLLGGRRGFLVNARDLCGAAGYAVSRFVSYGGAVKARRSLFAGPCGAAGRGFGRRGLGAKRMEG
jgi:hypothetical protein